ncbi:MAG: hypothetical protein U9N42_03510 [Campylobacterota bacterium]|nr:hypothetical protein [Campylobacterota bacterium]
MSKALNKKEQNGQRLRYIRVLERFSSSIVSYLFKSEEPTKEVYEKKIEANRKYYDRCVKVPLYKEEYTKLEELVKKMINYVNSQDDIEEIKSDILYTSNQIQKSINSRSYKKDKHANSKFNDGN